MISPISDPLNSKATCIYASRFASQPIIDHRDFLKAAAALVGYISAMGNTASRVPAGVWGKKNGAAFGRIYSFDALGTLYDFKQPVSEQYIRIARQCGIKGDLPVDQVAAAFKIAYKHQKTHFPIYGKGTKIKDPAIWWDALIHTTFRQVVPDEELPDDLGPRIYRHFSTGAAYNLRHDARAFFDAKKREMRKPPDYGVSGRFSQTPICCVISNSDPRVADILRDLGLKVGAVRPMNTFMPPLFKDFKLQDWDPSNDIDFVLTSYEADSEKPDKNIFEYARRQAVAVNGSRLLRWESQRTQDVPRWKDRPQMQRMEWYPNPVELKNSQWLHVGNDYEEDIRGACNAGIIPIYLVKDGKLSMWREKLGENGGYIITKFSELYQLARHDITPY